VDALHGSLSRCTLKGFIKILSGCSEARGRAKHFPAEISRMINQAGGIGFDDVPKRERVIRPKTNMCFRSAAHQKSLKSRDESLHAINNPQMPFFLSPKSKLVRIINFFFSTARRLSLLGLSSFHSVILIRDRLTTSFARSLVQINKNFGFFASSRLVLLSKGFAILPTPLHFAAAAGYFPLPPSCHAECSNIDKNKTEFH
jgi:hypothetical protein